MRNSTKIETCVQSKTANFDMRLWETFLSNEVTRFPNNTIPYFSSKDSARTLMTFQLFPLHTRFRSWSCTYQRNPLKPRSQSSTTSCNVQQLIECLPPEEPHPMFSSGLKTKPNVSRKSTIKATWRKTRVPSFPEWPVVTTLAFSRNTTKTSKSRREH